MIVYHNIYGIVLLILILGFTIVSDTEAHVDSTTIKTNDSFSDSLANKKLSKLPIVAFGLIGGFLGGAIGGIIDPPKKVPEGEFGLTISKTGAAGCVVGMIGGGYLGYRLAKRDLEHKKYKSTSLDSLRSIKP